MLTKTIAIARHLMPVLFFVSIASAQQPDGRDTGHPSAHPFATPSAPPPAPSLLGPRVISSEDDEFGITFSPDGKTCFFTKRTPSTISSSTYVICSSNYNIWMVKRTPTGWSEPIALDSTINSKYNEHFASIAANGNIYFSSDRPGAIGGESDADIYRSRFVDGKYMPAEHLDSVSSAAYELDCLISPDESFILTGCYNRRGGYGNYDIYYSLNKNGAWTGSKNLGPKVNSRFRDYSPRISPDGKYLFYTSEKDFSATQGQIADYPTLERNLHGVLNGSGNIYCIKIQDLDLK